MGGENRVMATQIGGNFLEKKKIMVVKLLKNNFEIIDLCGLEFRWIPWCFFG